MRQFFCYSVFFLFSLLSGCTSGRIEKPDIIFILVDDQRYDFLSFLDHPWIETPHIDRLAENSVYFDHAFVTTSLCSPSRASILTGQYTHTHRVFDNDTPLPASTPTFPQELQKGGYTTAFIGKWHMGGNNDMPRPGFDYWASFRGQGPYNNPEMNINGQRVEKSGYTPDILTELSTEFIKGRQDDERPLFLLLSHKSIHEPFTSATRHQNRYDNLTIERPESFVDSQENNAGKPQWLQAQRTSWHGAERDFSIQNYGDFDRFFELYSECMLGVDESIGEIVRTLEASGRLEETVIIYFSDNGYLMGEHGLIDKRVMHDPSIRVPAFIHWPEKMSTPFIDHSFILNIDLGPTILDIAGLQAPPTMYGASFLPLALGEATFWRDAFVYEYFVDPKAVQTPTIFGLRSKDYSYMTYHGVWDIYELYDMKNDPDQLHNLLGEITYGYDYGTFLQHVERQDPALYDVVKPLDEQLTELLNQYDGSRLPSWGK